MHIAMHGFQYIVRWVALAWEKVKPETISKCSRKAGVLQDATMDVVARTHDTEDDPFLESDACMELQNLLEKTMPIILTRDVPLQNICVVKK